MNKQGGYLYIIKSKKSGRYYIGDTNNLDRRLKEHNRGNNKSTRNKGLWIFVYTEKLDSLKEAKIREVEIKKWKSKKMIEKLIVGTRPPSQA